MSAFPLDRSSFIPLSAEFFAHSTPGAAGGTVALSEASGLGLRLSDSNGAWRWRVRAIAHFGVAASRWIDQMPIDGGRKITL